MYQHSSTYRPDIDGLRAIAVLGVIFYHYFGVRGGFTGVDIFFVISGYLITRILLTEFESNQFKFLKFYDRRIKRLLPSLIVVLATSLLVGFFGLLSDEYKNLGWHTLWGGTFLSNIALWAESGYFDKAAESKPLLHLWSLGIEEQFYLIWPIIILSIFKIKHKWPALIFIFTCSFITNIALIQTSTTTSFYWLFSRAWEFILGAGIAKIQLTHTSLDSKFPKIFFNFIGVVAFAAILLVFAKLNSQELYPGFWALIPTIGTALIILSKNSIFNQKILENKILVYFGLISYPLYLWHWPALTFARIMSNGELETYVKILALVISILLAVTCYHLLEKKVRHNQGAGFSLLLLSIAISIGLVGLMVYNNNGFPKRFPKHEALLGELGPTPDGLKLGIHYHPCDSIHNLPQSSNIQCRVAKTNLAPTIAIIGDSHAGQNYPGLAAEHKNSPHNIILLYRGACVPLINTQVFRKGKSDSCLESFSQIFKFIEASPSIKTVILSFRAPWFLYGGGKAFTQKYKYPYIVSPSIDIGLKKTHEYFKSINREMILIIDNPELDFLPHECVDIRPIKLGFKLKDICGVPKTYAETIALPYFKIIEQLKTEIPDLKIFNAFKYFCDQAYCYAKIDGQFLYSDGNHLNGEGSIYIAKKFMAERKEDFKKGLSDTP